MNTTAAAVTVVVVLAVSLPAAYWQFRRAQRHEAQRARFIRAVEEKADTARKWPAIEEAWDLDAYDGPDLNARLERLRQAIRDEQRKGEL